MNAIKRSVLVLSALVLGLSLLFSQYFNVDAAMPQQNPVPTVTPLDRGVVATVKAGMTDPVKVRSGPSTLYSEVGVLLIGQSVTAKGRTDGGLWILIEYPGAQGGIGWVYAPYMDLTPGELPVVEPPPTVTPATTATIDPTLAAQFIVTAMPTRLPTFTESPPLVIATYAPDSGGQTLAGIPIGLVILLLAGIGLFMGLLSILQNR